MKKVFLTCVFALAVCMIASATVQCRFIVIQIDSNEVQPIDVDGDGTNDYVLHAEEAPYISNYIVGVNGNELEVRSSVGVEAHRARRITSGDPVGMNGVWNDTAYMIENGQGAFTGGTEEYGHVGLRMNKGDGFHYAFLEVRAPYWQAYISVYSEGYNDAALAETRTDACPHPVGIDDKVLLSARAFIAGEQLHISLQGEAAKGAQVQIINTAGQVVLTGMLQQAETDILLSDIPDGVYLVAVLRNESMILREKVVVRN